MLEASSCLKGTLVKFVLFSITFKGIHSSWCYCCFNQVIFNWAKINVTIMVIVKSSFLSYMIHFKSLSFIGVSLATLGFLDQVDLRKISFGVNVFFIFSQLKSTLALLLVIFFNLSLCSVQSSCWSCCGSWCCWSCSAAVWCCCEAVFFPISSLSKLPIMIPRKSRSPRMDMINRF